MELTIRLSEFIKEVIFLNVIRETLLSSLWLFWSGIEESFSDSILYHETIHRERIEKKNAQYQDQKIPAKVIAPQ